MIGQLIMVMMAISLWPLIAMSLLVSMFAISLIIHVPGIYGHFRWNTWLWPAMGIVLVVEAVGTWLVMHEPFSGFPGGSLSPTPTATIALLASSWALLAWVVACELTAKMEREREMAGESLESYLAPFESKRAA